MKKFINSDMKYLEYAVDLNIYYTIESMSSHETPQSAVDVIARWRNENGMVFCKQKYVI